MSKKIVVLSLLALLASCASTDNKDSQRFKKYDDYIVNNDLISLSKIRTFKFQNWKSLDNKHLILSSSHKKQYLISLQSYCVDLVFTPSIGLKQAMSTSLSAGFDSIVVSKQPQQDCRIKSIHELSQDQEKQVLELRKASK